MYGPRYTSYPTAIQFRESADTSLVQQALEKANEANSPLSLYVHVPFCEHVCYYCACNRVITANHRKSEPYLESLYREIDYYASLSSPTRPVNQLHFGGGTPTYLDDAQLAALMQKLQQAFSFKADDSIECSIEIDPRTVDKQRLAGLRQLGFSRLSMGVQDLHKPVQEAINRVPERISNISGC